MKKVIVLALLIIAVFGVTSCENDGRGQDSPLFQNNQIEGVRPEIKRMIDSYEDFFDEYCSFMRSYKNSTDVMSMMDKYLDYLSKYTEMLSKFEALENYDLNAAELLYYQQANARIMKKLNSIL